MGCATATIKYLVFIFNTLCALLGIGTIVVNALALKNAAEEAHTNLILMITLGSIVFVVAFFGCCGAIRENTCLTWTYAVFLLVLVVANLTIMLGFTAKINAQERAEADINKGWAYELKGVDALAKVQNELNCCGKNSSNDYIAANITIPATCYLAGNSTNTEGLFKEGCLLKLTELYAATEHVLSIFSWTSLGVESIAFVCAFILAITFRNQKRRANY